MTTDSRSNGGQSRAARHWRALGLLAALVLAVSACSQPTATMPNPAFTANDFVIAGLSSSAGAEEPQALRESTVSGIITVSANERDYIAKVDYYLGGKGNLVANATEPPFEAKIDTKKLPNGKHTLIARAWVRSADSLTPYEFDVLFTVKNGKDEASDSTADGGKGDAATDEADDEGKAATGGASDSAGDDAAAGEAATTAAGAANEAAEAQGNAARTGTSAAGAQNAPVTVAPAALRGDPGFDAGALGDEAGRRYAQLEAAIGATTDEVAALAAAGDLHDLGRDVNVHVSTLLTVFRHSGDLALLDEVDAVMQAARGALRDTNGDGYRNWRWLEDRGNALWYGDDRSEVDESLTHGFVAAVAWAYQNNRDLTSPSGVNYGERADFWKSYLLHDFEAKWRARNGVEAGSKAFLDPYLLHTAAQHARFHWYMGRLTGDGAYTAEAERLAGAVKSASVTVAAGEAEAYVYPWGMGAAARFLMPLAYGQYVAQAVQDLALDGAAALGAMELALYANGAASFIVGDGYAPTVGGSRSVGGLPVGRDDGSRSGAQWARLAYAPALAAADASGTIAADAAELAAAREAAGEPASVPLSAALYLHAAAAAD